MGIKAILSRLLLSPYVGSLIRHGLTAAGAILVAKGVIDSGQAADFVDAAAPVIVGGVGWVIGQGASLLEKRDR